MTSKDHELSRDRRELLTATLNLLEATKPGSDAGVNVTMNETAARLTLQRRINEIDEMLRDRPETSEEPVPPPFVKLSLAPESPSDASRRRLALDKALEHAAHVAPHLAQLPMGADVGADAERFLAFLRGEEEEEETRGD